MLQHMPVSILRLTLVEVMSECTHDIGIEAFGPTLAIMANTSHGNVWWATRRSSMSFLQNPGALRATEKYTPQIGLTPLQNLHPSTGETPTFKAMADRQGQDLRSEDDARTATQLGRSPRALGAPSEAAASSATKHRRLRGKVHVEAALGSRSVADASGRSGMSTSGKKATGARRTASSTAGDLESPNPKAKGSCEDMARVHELESKLVLSDLLDGVAMGDKLYAARRFRPGDPAAQMKMSRLLRKVGINSHVALAELNDCI